MKGPFNLVSYYSFSDFKLQMLFTFLTALLQTAYLIIPPGLEFGFTWVFYYSI